MSTAVATTKSVDVLAYPSAFSGPTERSNLGASVSFLTTTVSEERFMARSEARAERVMVVSVEGMTETEKATSLFNVPSNETEVADPLVAK